MSNKEIETIKTNKSASSPTPSIKPKMKNKTISFKDIQKQNKKMDQMATYILETDYESNTNTVIKYYEKFSQSRIDSLLKEAYANLQIAEEEGIEFFQQGDMDANFHFYISFLTAVRFTSLGKDVPSTVSEQMPLMMAMYNKGLLNRIHDEVLDQAEVAKITDKIGQLADLVNKIANLEDSTRNEILSSVQNKEILGSRDPHQDVIHPLVNLEADK